MIKDIVVNLSVGERASPAEDYALSVAATFDAHVTGIAYSTLPSSPCRVPVTPSATSMLRTFPEMIAAQQRDNDAATTPAIDRFAAASARAGVSTEPLTLSVNFSSAGDPVRSYCAAL